MTVETWGLEMEDPIFHPDELFGRSYISRLPTPPQSPDEAPLGQLDLVPDLGMELPDLGYQYVADVLTTLPILENGSSSKVKSEPSNSYFSKSDPMCSGIVKTEPFYQPETMYPVVKSEPMDTSFVKPEESLEPVLMDIDLKSEPIDTGFDPLDEPLDAIESDNFLDSIANYYEPVKKSNRYGMCSLPCDSDCEEDDSVASCVPKPEFREDVLNNDCMWNGLDEVKKVKTEPLEEPKVTDPYIPRPVTTLHYKPAAQPSPKIDSCTNVKVPNGSFENSTLSDHCYYNNGLPTPSESDDDEEEEQEQKISSASEDSDDTVTMPNNATGVLKFITLDNSAPVGYSLSHQLTAALNQLRKNGKPVNPNTVLEVTIPGKRRYRLRVAEKPPRGRIPTVKNEEKRAPVTILSPLRTTESRVTTVPAVSRPRRTTRRRQVAASPPVKARRRRQNMNSPRKRRTSSGSDSDGSEDTCRGGKRVFHNNMERQRRIHLRQSFENLKYLVPNLKERSKTPKVLTLRESASYCNQLLSQESQLLREKEALQAKQRELKTRLKLLKSQQPYY